MLYRPRAPATPQGFKPFSGQGHKLGDGGRANAALIAPTSTPPDRSIPSSFSITDCLSKCTKVTLPLHILLTFASCAIGILGIGGNITLNPMAKIALGLNVPILLLTSFNFACFFPKKDVCERGLFGFEALLCVAVICQSIYVFNGMKGITTGQLGGVMLASVATSLFLSNLAYCKEGYDLNYQKTYRPNSIIVEN